MNCVVTAGPTYEPLDRVRRLTNLSTGRLGIGLAAFLTEKGNDVTLLLGEQATHVGERKAARVEQFGTTEDLRSRMEQLSREDVGAVFHAAAVSDFGFGRVWRQSMEGDLVEVEAGKISSRVEGLTVELVPTRKIIAELRGWYPEALLVGWKYEVDGDRAGAIKSAERQLADNRTDGAVVNGPAYGTGYGLMTRAGPCRHVETVEELYGVLGGLVGTSL